MCLKSFYAVIIWDYDSGDSAGKTAAQQKTLYDQLAAKKPSNVLVLHHSVYNTTVDDVVPYALNLLKNKGYKFVTVSQCLGISPYQSIVAPSVKDVRAQRPELRPVAHSFSCRARGSAEVAPDGFFHCL